MTWSRRPLPALLAIFAAAALVYLIVLPTIQVGTFYDDALYITLAQSLSRGDGFRRIELPTAPETTFVPFGFPLLLTPYVAAFPGEFAPLQWLSLSFALGNLALLWLYARRRLDSTLALLVVALFAFQPNVVSLTTQILSENAYIFFTLLSLLILDRYVRTDRVLSLAGVALVLSAAMTYFIRVPGLTFIAAIALYLAWRREWRRALLFAGAVGLMVGVWLWRNWQVAGTLISREYVLQGTRAGIEGYLQQALAGLADYSSLIPTAVIPLLTPQVSARLWQLSPLIPILFLLLIWFILGVGMVARGRQALETSDFYLGLSGILLLVWGREQPRYLVPLIPFLYIYFVSGIAALIHRARKTFAVRWRPQWAVVAIAMLVLMLNLARDAQAVIDPPRNHIPDLSLGTLWLREHSEPNALVMTMQARTTRLYSSRRTIPYPWANSVPASDANYVYGDKEYQSDSPAELLNRAIQEFAVDYLLVAPPNQVARTPFSFELGEYERETVLPVLAQQPERFELVYSEPRQHVFVYQVKYR